MAQQYAAPLQAHQHVALQYQYGAQHHPVALQNQHSTRTASASWHWAESRPRQELSIAGDHANDVLSAALPDKLPALQSGPRCGTVYSNTDPALAEWMENLHLKRGFTTAEAAWLGGMNELTLGS